MIIVYMWRPKDWKPELAPQAVSHIAIAFTGLEDKSFYIDWDSGKTPDFITTDFWYATKHYGDNPIRVAIPTKEDGNENGLDEKAALEWWKVFKSKETFSLSTNNCASAVVGALLAAGSGKLLPTKSTTDTAVAAEYANNLSYLVLDANPDVKLGVTIEDFNTKQKSSRGSTKPDQEKSPHAVLASAESLNDEKFLKDNIGKKVVIHRQTRGAFFEHSAYPVIKKLSEHNDSETLQRKYAFLLALRKACFRKYADDKKIPQGIKEIMGLLKVGIGQSEQEVNSMFNQVSKVLESQKKQLSGKTSAESMFYEKYYEMSQSISPIEKDFLLGRKFLKPG